MIRWLLSGTVREAAGMAKQVRKMLHAQRDILRADAIEAVSAELEKLEAAVNGQAGEKELRARMADMEKAAGQHFKMPRHSGWRENIEVMLVAIAVAMAIRTFFLQPFKIPTGSMQPTLYGIDVNRMADGEPVPGILTRIGHGVAFGTFYHHLVADHDGQFVGFGPPRKFLRFINRQAVIVNYNQNGQQVTRTHRLWFTPEDLGQWVRVSRGEEFSRGEVLFKLREVSGDHLFVNRVTYNFRRPQRGEIIVFQTAGISGLDPSLYYIKRLVGLGGEEIQIGTDRHVRINGERLDASVKHFERIYSFKSAPRDSQYSGHVPAPMMLSMGTTRFQIHPGHYFVLGDNTMNSLDSRAWGDFPQENVIGKSSFVYWPISPRFGWSHTATGGR